MCKPGTFAWRKMYSDDQVSLRRCVPRSLAFEPSYGAATLWNCGSDTIVVNNPAIIA